MQGYLGQKPEPTWALPEPALRVLLLPASRAPTNSGVLQRAGPGVTRPPASSPSSLSQRGRQHQDPQALAQRGALHTAICGPLRSVCSAQEITGHRLPKPCPLGHLHLGPPDKPLILKRSYYPDLPNQVTSSPWPQRLVQGGSHEPPHPQLLLEGRERSSSAGWNVVWAFRCLRRACGQ